MPTRYAHSVYIRIYVYVLVRLYIIQVRYSYVLDQSRYTIIRSGAYVRIGSSSAIYVYALVHTHNRRSLAVYSVTAMVMHNGLCFWPCDRIHMVPVYVSLPDLYCYSLFYFIDYDPEEIWSLVQRHNGNIQPQPGGHYDFYIHRDYASILVLAFPLLKRQRQKDLYT